MMPKAERTKENIDQLDFINIKHLCASKATANRVKSHPKGWENVFANHTSGKGLILYWQLLKLNSAEALLAGCRGTSVPVRPARAGAGGHHSSKHLAPLSWTCSACQASKLKLRSNLPRFHNLPRTLTGMGCVLSNLIPTQTQRKSLLHSFTKYLLNDYCVPCLTARILRL